MAGLFLLMKARFFTTVILLLFLCAIFCSCDGIFNSPFRSEYIENQPAKTFRLYVYGAVAREGYYEVQAGSAYDKAIQLAGILTVSVLPTFAATTVDGNLTQVAVNYYDGQTARECVNVNSDLVKGRYPVEGISDEIVTKLADYVDVHGKITNKQQLEVALGDDYSTNFYKFFVAEEDYE